MTWVNVAAWVPVTEAEGPGRRAALWVQGCQFLCPGCCNPGFLRIAPRDLITSADLLDRLTVAASGNDLEGITFLGGEPMLQARGLAEVACGAREMGLSVMVFSGYTLEALRSSPLPGSDLLLARTDVLVDGQYVASMPETQRAWAGSSNQRFHYLTSRYDRSIERTDDGRQRVELRVSSTGRVDFNGWPADVQNRGAKRRVDPPGTAD